MSLEGDNAQGSRMARIAGSVAASYEGPYDKALKDLMEKNPVVFKKYCSGRSSYVVVIYDYGYVVSFGEFYDKSTHLWFGKDEKFKGEADWKKIGEELKIPDAKGYFFRNEAINVDLESGLHLLAYNLRFIGNVIKGINFDIISSDGWKKLEDIGVKSELMEARKELESALKKVEAAEGKVSTKAGK